MYETFQEVINTYLLGFAWGGIGMYAMYRVAIWLAHVPLVAAVASILAMIACFLIGRYLAKIVTSL